MNTSTTTRPRLLYKRFALLSRLLSVLFAFIGLCILIWSDRSLLGNVVWLFIVSTLLVLGFEAYIDFSPYLRNRFGYSIPDTHQEKLPMLLYPPSNLLYERRSIVRVLLFILAAIACGLVALRLIQMVDLSGRAVPRGITAGLFCFTAITYIAWMQYEIIRNFSIGQSWKFWFFISLVIGLAIGLSLFYQRSNEAWWVFVFAAALWGFGTTWVNYVERRIGISDRVWSEVIHDLSLRLMDVDALRENRAYIIDMIGKRLRYERVFLLEPLGDRLTLRVMAEYGDYPSVIGKTFPSDAGITGQAFRTGKVSAWNDVKKCPYYHQLIPKDLDTTRAEIAMPIQYRGEIYGVLDIQSRYSTIYAQADIRSLETIADILAAAMATEKADAILAEANNLWNQLSREIRVDKEAFNLIADFGRNKLGADLVIYYPLSPSGYPFKTPYVVGKLFEPDKLLSNSLDPSGPLAKLIDTWLPHFESDVGPNSIFYHHQASPSPSFAIRENIRSVSIIPIGTKDERLGIVFLNYRRRFDFDSLYKLTVMAFAQAFATIASRERYRHIVFDGFGRPELGLHNIQARYGLKDGVLQEGRRVFTTSCRTVFQSSGEVQDCGMFDILRNVDHFLTEIRAQTSVEYDILNRTLREAFQDFTRRMKEQSTNQHPWFIIELDPQVERESPWTRLALYRILTETVNNGIFHGHASELDILVQRKERSIYLRVTNNGNPLPEEARRNRGRGGIFTLLDELEVQFGARVSIRGGENGDGTIVEAEIPALPIQSEVSHV